MEVEGLDNGAVIISPDLFGGSLEDTEDLCGFADTGFGSSGLFLSSIFKEEGTFFCSPLGPSSSWSSPSSSPPLDLLDSFVSRSTATSYGTASTEEAFHKSFSSQGRTKAFNPS